MQAAGCRRPVQRRPKIRPQNPRFFSGWAAGAVGAGAAFGCATDSGAVLGAAAAGAAGLGAGVMVADATVIGGARCSKW